MKLHTVALFTSILLCTLAHSQQTVEQLSEKIEAVNKAKSVESLKALRFTKGEPKELSEAMDAMIELFGRKDLDASEPEIHVFAERTPNPPLPGSFQGKELEYLVPPTHWIVVKLSSPEGKQPKLSFVLTLPVATVDGVWRILGVRYK